MAIVLGGVALGSWLSHEGEALMFGINTLIEMSLNHLPGEVSEKSVLHAK